MDNKVMCQTPTPGKQPTRIDRWKYDAVRRSIIDSLDEHPEGILFKELPARVAEHLSKHEQTHLGSIAWYTTTVKLDMEVRGELQRVNARGAQRLTRRNP